MRGRSSECGMRERAGEGGGGAAGTDGGALSGFCAALLAVALAREGGGKASNAATGLVGLTGSMDDARAVF
jgi:hypothetical protein